MTYAVALRLEGGLVFAADTRTNAGVDNIAQYKKLQHWQCPGDRVLVLLAAGNLAVTQAVVSLLNEHLAEDENEEMPTLFTAPNMYRAARVVGDAIREARRIDGAALEASKLGFNTNFIFGGQIKGEQPRLFQIYPEGNFIEAGPDTPFFQIGETKYGKPILIRAHEMDLSFEETAKLLLVSFDSTVKSNLSVGLPLDLLCYPADSFKVGHQKRIEQDDPCFRAISDGWSQALRSAFKSLPDFEF